MARRRCLVCVLALFACSQSLFDSHPDSDKDGGGGGGGDGGGNGDGSIPVSDCPEPCAGDAAADFGGEQGGTNDAWYYLRDTGSANGVDYAELTFSTWQGIDAWSNGGLVPAIASCTGQDDPACAGLDGFVLLVPGSGGERPALAFRAPETATYEISGAARVADGGPTDVPMQFLVSRAGRHDAVALQTVRTSESEVGISGLVPALVGDEVIVSIASANDDPPPLGVRLFFTRVDSGGDVFPGSCQLALRFTVDDLADECGNAPIMNLNDEIGPPGLTTSGEGPSARLGNGRVFDQGQFMQLGNSAMDYSGDFTIQFWAKLVEPQPSFNATPFCDWSDIASLTHGGQGIFRDDDSGSTDFCFYSRDLADPMCLTANTPTDGGWHFWRIVRSTADARWRVCIDGGELGQTPVPASANMTGDQPPRLGRNIDFEPAYFGGTLDEVRIFKQELPCVTAP